jgi:hypothetical protein
VVRGHQKAGKKKNLVAKPFCQRGQRLSLTGNSVSGRTETTVCPTANKAVKKRLEANKKVGLRLSASRWLVLLDQKLVHRPASGYGLDHSTWRPLSPDHPSTDQAAVLGIGRGPVLVNAFPSAMQFLDQQARNRRRSDRIQQCFLRFPQ